MKICNICKNNFQEQQRTQKYCSNKCAYTAIDNKRLIKSKKCSMVRCIACNGKGKVKRIVRFVLSENQKKQILSMYRKGYGIREIQRELEIKHPYTVSYYIKTCNKERFDR